MSTTRQFSPDPGGYPIRGLAQTFQDGAVIDAHTHPWAQLIYAARGVMQVSTPAATWMVPPTRAIWVPGGTAHAIRMRGQVAMRTLYLTPIDPDARLTACRAVEVAPLLRELILHLVQLRMLRLDNEAQQRLVGLLLDLLAAGETAPLELPMPRDPRARRLAERIMEQPGAEASLAELARGAGGSLRTLQRLFQAETRLTLETWRARARMQQAVAALAGGAPVTATALEAGYASPSAFVAAFRRTFGVTPSRYRARAA